MDARREKPPGEDIKKTNVIVLQLHSFFDFLTVLIPGKNGVTKHTWSLVLKAKI